MSDSYSLRSYLAKDSNIVAIDIPESDTTVQRGSEYKHAIIPHTHLQGRQTVIVRLELRVKLCSESQTKQHALHATGKSDLKLPSLSQK